jgi:hypothetical protein
MTSQDEVARRWRAEMIRELRRRREVCEPKQNSNPLYHAYSLAISAIKKVDALSV